MRATIVLVAVVGLTVAGGAGAAVNGRAAESLAKKNGCLTCHAADKRLFGPSFKEIAAKYKDDRNAESKLLNVIKKGGSGVLRCDGKRCAVVQRVAQAGESRMGPVRHRLRRGK